MIEAHPRLRFGIIGVGMIADYHAQAIRAAHGATLVGVASRSAENVRAFAEKHSIPFFTTHMEELVTRPDIDVVCITTPSGAHLEPALAAIQAGKHVAIEKPLEITTQRVDQILHAARAAGVRVAPIFQARFGAGARTLKAAVESMRFGQLVLCSAYVKWHRAAQYYQGWKGTLALDGGGVVINQAIHGIDLLQWLIGMPAEVFAWKTRRVHIGIEAEDTACASLRFESGALGSIEASTALWPGWSRRIEITGERGSAALEDDRITRWDFREPWPRDDEVRAFKPDEGMRGGSSAANAISIDGHVRQLQDLIDGLREKRPLLIEGAEGRKAVALVNALYASAEREAPVALKEFVVPG